MTDCVLTPVDEAAAALADAVLSLRPLIDALPQPIRVVPLIGDEHDRTPPSRVSRAHDLTAVQDLLTRVTHRLQAPSLTVQSASDRPLDLFERVVSGRLALQREVERLCDTSNAAADHVDEIIDAAADRRVDRCWTRRAVRSFDGSVVHAYAAGAEPRAAIVLASACGMPSALCERWMRTLGERCRVITWETRGLFGDAAFDGVSCDARAQANDLIAVMDAFGVERAHVMGFCGGAAVALVAAANWPARISSISLWHGDFECGDGTPKTSYQADLKVLLTMAAESRAEAAAIRDVFRESAGARALDRTIRPDVAHLVLYPFANAELFFRYATVNGALMSADVGGVSEQVRCPALVVTSEDDRTIHPEGSKRVARRLPNAVLHVEASGDHLAAFDATLQMVGVLERFLSSTDGGGNDGASARP